MTEPDCDAVAQTLPELALGVLDGRERAATLAHVEACPACRHELARMSEVADALVELTPGVEPPAGFETRVLAALRPAAHDGGGTDTPAVVTPLAEPPRRRRRFHRGPAQRRLGGRRGPVALAAAVVVALGCAAGGWTVGRTGGEHSSPRVLTADLRQGGHDLGEVIATTGPQPWIAMAVETNLGSASVECKLQGVHGATVDAGWFNLSDGSGYWSAPVPPAAWPLRAAVVLDASGHTLGTATLKG